MWLNNESSSPNEEEEEELAQHPNSSLLPSILHEYETLVQDMAAQLAASQLALVSSANRGQSSDDEMSTKNAMISALQTQIELVTKSKQVSQNMAALILERVEELEMERQRKSNNLEEISPQILRKWEDLNSYTILLEAKTERMEKELDFYKRKVFEMREEEEGMRKCHQQDKLKIIQNSRFQCQQEIDKLESQIEKLKQDSEGVIKGRLEKERESWEFEEAQKLVLVRVQVEELLKENHFLVLREQELQRLAFAMEGEREEMRQRLFHATFQLAQASQQLQQLALPMLESEKASKQCQTGPTEEELLASQNNKGRHEEEKRVESIQKHLEAERELLICQLKSVESGAVKNSDRLQGRIAQLEVLNINLRSQLKDAEDKEEERAKREEGLKCRIKELEIDVNNQIPSELLKKELEDLKQNFIANLKFGESVMEDKRKDLVIARLRSEIQRLVHLVEKQSQISSCWKSEFKKLAQQSLNSKPID